MSSSVLSLLKVTISSVILLVYIASCTQNQTPDEDDILESGSEKLLKNVKMGDFEIVVIEDCEYIIFTHTFGVSARGYGFMAHKGNCVNPIHVYNVVSDSLERIDSN